MKALVEMKTSARPRPASRKGHEVAAHVVEREVPSDAAADRDGGDEQQLDRGGRRPESAPGRAREPQAGDAAAFLDLGQLIHAALAVASFVPARHVPKGDKTCALTERGGGQG
jgi:hypothetical protein